MKYKLTDETIVVGNITLHRIECVTAFSDVECGDKGGWIESENNLSQEDDAWVFGNATVGGVADYIVFKNWWSSGRYFTWTRSNNKWNVGCFFGSGEELVAKAYKDSEKSGREYERVVKYVESILKEDNDNGNRNKCEG